MLDESYQPTAKVDTKGKKAALAFILNECIGLPSKKFNNGRFKDYFEWKAFEILWNVTKLSASASSSKTKGEETPKYYADYKKLLAN